MADELLNGPFTLKPGNHELAGLVAFVIGFILISKYPKGKDI